MNKKIFPYIRLAIGIALAYFISRRADYFFIFFEHTSDSELLMTFFVIAIICVFSFIVFYLTSGTAFPSFVVAIFFGLSAQPLFTPITQGNGALGALVGFGATLILFGGGLETPWINFKKLFWKIFSLSFPGLFITALLFSFAVAFIGKIYGVNIPVTVAVLLGAVLASTDPAAIIPILKQLRFANCDTKDIIVSESALTDVAGTLLTVVFLSILSAGTIFTGISSGYGELFSANSAIVLFKQLTFGVIFGIIGYGLLEVLTRFKKTHEKEFEADAAFFLFVPIIIFTVALSLGGSGYLAAFIAGLLFVLTEKLHDTEKFFNHTIEGFFKPVIFLLLGALVDIQSLITYAVVGIIASFVFMFIIRPISVFIALGPFSFFGKNRLGAKELLFISFVRETGAIPAVLLITIVNLGFPGLDGLVAIGMWVILATLIIEPPLTPLIARFLNVAEQIADEKELKINGGNDPFVILGSRGHSFIKRLPFVTEWAEKHNIKKVVVLHCLEDKYTSELAQTIGAQAEKEFTKINKERESQKKSQIHFSYISRTGFLQNNIDELSREQKNITAIFVGRKVLDYRLEDIKQLAVPLFFID